MSQNIMNIVVANSNKEMQIKGVKQLIDLTSSVNF